MQVLIFSTFVYFFTTLASGNEVKKSFTPFEEYSMGLNVSSLTLVSDPLTPIFMRIFHKESQDLAIGLEADSGSFLIQTGEKEILEITNKDEILFKTENLKLEGLKYSGSVYFGKLKQWKLIIHEPFTTTPQGWSNSSLSTCGGINMLGGYGNFAGGEVKKLFKDLPPHKFLRITANFHFIDSWSGETGFMRLSSGIDGEFAYTWTESHSTIRGASSTNICGAKYPENKLTSPIDVIIPHQLKTVTIGFGSTLDQDAYENSFGVSNLSIFIR